MWRVAAVFVVGALAGCAAAVPPGTVMVRTDPDGATCTVRRHGQVLGTVDPTPGRVSVDPSERALDVSCSKPGWQTATGVVPAIYNGVGLGQLLAGGAAAVVEGAAKGTDFHYDPAGVTLVLAPAAGG